MGKRRGESGGGGVPAPGPSWDSVAARGDASRDQDPGAGTDARSEENVQLLSDRGLFPLGLGPVTRENQSFFISRKNSFIHSLVNFHFSSAEIPHSRNWV